MSGCKLWTYATRPIPKMAARRLSVAPGRICKLRSPVLRQAAVALGVHNGYKDAFAALAAHAGRPRPGGKNLAGTYCARDLTRRSRWTSFEFCWPLSFRRWAYSFRLVSACISGSIFFSRFWDTYRASFTPSGSSSKNKNVGLTRWSRKRLLSGDGVAFTGRARLSRPARPGAYRGPVIDLPAGDNYRLGIADTGAGKGAAWNWA